MFDIKQELKNLPEKPGVYLMKNGNQIIYVGKAVILKNRVRQYFQKNNKTARIEKMVSLITSFEYIVTDSEVEALMLECNLIKLYRPKFNVMLKDDKMYPYIKITNEDFPVVYMTRRLVNDGGKYFGPYTDIMQVKEALSYIKNEYKIRQCRTSSKQLFRKDRACINYQMGKCLAPCRDYISKEEYSKMIDEISHILSGNISDIVKKLEKEMQEYSEKFEFEKAAQIRDRINNIKSLIQTQKVSNFNENDIDVIGTYRSGDKVCLQIFFVRKQKLIGRENYFFEDTIDIDEAEIINSFMKQYYTKAIEIPSKIMVKYDIEDESLIEFLNNKKGTKVEIKTPKKGQKLKFVEMAENNAKIALENLNKNINLNKEYLEKLTKLLDISLVSKKVECYDISNISGTNIVGGMIVLENGDFKKSKYKKFKIRDMEDQDDPRCMAQVIDRRLNKSINENNEAFNPLPDLILLDGGITQINAVKSILEKYNVKIDIFGMVKDDKHRTRALMDIDGNIIEFNDDDIKRYVTNIQDEIHNYTITYHRKLRDSEISKSKLDEISGIGDKKKIELLKKFGSIEEIKNATIEDLVKVKGITHKLANDILDKLNK